MKVDDSVARPVKPRRHQRIVVPEGVTIRVSGGDDGQPVAGIATVIGLDGMFFRTSTRRPIGSVMRLLVECPGFSFHVAQCMVRSVNDHGMGAEFTAISEEDQLELAKLLLQLRVRVPPS